VPSDDGPVVMLLEQIKESLEREMQNLGKEIHNFREEMTVRFDNQNARLDRQAWLIQTGQQLAKLEGRSKRAS
jgi:hypothetical protein